MRVPHPLSKDLYRPTEGVWFKCQSVRSPSHRQRMIHCWQRIPTSPTKECYYVLLRLTSEHVPSLSKITTEITTNSFLSDIHPQNTALLHFTLETSLEPRSPGRLARNLDTILNQMAIPCQTRGRGGGRCRLLTGNNTVTRTRTLREPLPLHQRVKQHTFIHIKHWHTARVADAACFRRGMTASACF